MKSFCANHLQVITQRNRSMQNVINHPFFEAFCLPRGKSINALCTHVLKPCPNVSITPLRQWDFRQCLPFSWTTLWGKHCRHSIAVMGVVDTFGHWLRSWQNDNYLFSLKMTILWTFWVKKMSFCALEIDWFCFMMALVKP